MNIRIGTRGSELAMWQARFVAGLLGTHRTEIIVIKTQGDAIQNVSFDKMEGKGFFTREIEQALLEKTIDLAVHSLKDLPTENPSGLIIAAVPEREDPADRLLVSPGAWDERKDLCLKEGAVVGTSSMRRLAQLKLLRRDLIIEPLRGNVNTRVRKLREGRFDAIVMAAAAILRIELAVDDLRCVQLDTDVFMPAPAQGALGLQAREYDAETLRAVAPLNHPGTERAVSAERAFLRHFGGGCHIPLGALAEIEAGGALRLRGIVAATDGSEAFRAEVIDTDPEKAGARLARLLQEKGADRLL
jgi:hydroxymethylbilane synthase